MSRGKRVYHEHIYGIDELTGRITCWCGVGIPDEPEEITYQAWCIECGISFRGTRQNTICPACTKALGVYEE